MSPAALLRAISRLTAVAADVADGTIPSVGTAEALLFDTAAALGLTHLLRSDLTPAAVARVDAIVDDAIAKKTGG